VDWQSWDFVLVFLSRLYTKRQEPECDGGADGCCVNRERNEDDIIVKTRHIETLTGNGVGK